MEYPRSIYGYFSPGSSLVPNPKDIVAKFEQAAAIENNNFNPTGGALVVELFWNPSNGTPTDLEHVKSLVKTMERKLDAYEKILSRQKYLADDELSLADLFHLPFAHSLIEVWDTMDESFLLTNVCQWPFFQRDKMDLVSSRPNVARWYKDISARPSWQAVKDAA